MTNLPTGALGPALQSFLVPPWDHQKKAIEFANFTNNLALFFEMGTGKTGTTINILRQHFMREKRLMKVLILGPVIVVKNWQNEFKLHSKIDPRQVVALLGPGKKRVKHFTDNAYETGHSHSAGQPKPCIFVTNYEAMEMETLHKEILAWAPDILVCDESHRLKNPDSIRAKRVVQIADRARYHYILTGTPILNSAMDIFNQYRVLDGGETFGKNYYEFRGRYFEDVNAAMPAHIRFPKWVPKADTYEELNSKIYRKALRVKKSECLDLPPLIRQRIDVPLGKDQERLYNEMKADYIAWVKEHENSGEPRAVVAQMAITKALRLQQIVSGYVKTEEGIEIQLTQNPRLTQLGELLEELTPEHKVIVWATFHANYRQIAQLCQSKGIGYTEIHGGISHTDRVRAMERLRSDASCRVVIANQGAAGIGINLVEASYSIFYSRNFSLEHDLQAEARNYRGGSEIHEKVTRIDLVAPETIDELVLESLAGKQNIAEQVLAWNEKL